jgi:hypothetical protein
MPSAPKNPRRGANGPKQAADRNGADAKPRRAWELLKDLPDDDWQLLQMVLSPQGAAIMAELRALLDRQAKIPLGRYTDEVRAARDLLAGSPDMTIREAAGCIIAALPRLGPLSRGKGAAAEADAVLVVSTSEGRARRETVRTALIRTLEAERLAEEARQAERRHVAIAWKAGFARFVRGLGSGDPSARSLLANAIREARLPERVRGASLLPSGSITLERAAVEGAMAAARSMAGLRTKTWRERQHK